jgi:hypothetical protein
MGTTDEFFVQKHSIYIYTRGRLVKNKMQEGKAVEILAEYGLKPCDITEWPFADAETLRRIARVTVVNRHLQTQSGCEPLLWNPPPSVEDPDDKKLRESAGLLPVEWDNIKGHHGTVCGIGLSRYAYACMIRKCRSKKALLLRGDGDKSRLFLLASLKKFAETSVLRGNCAGDDLLATAKDIVREAQTSANQK